MFDLGIFTIPIIGALSVFTVALFLGEDIVIEKIEVTHQMEWNGYNSVVATRQLTDSLRELGVNAASELTGLEVDESDVEKGVEAFEDYFEISVLINGTRNVFGMIPYYVDGEITEKRGEATIIARIFKTDEEGETVVDLVTATRDTNDMHGLMHDAALQILERINPYIVALYYRKQEAAADPYDFDFPKTHATVKHFLEERPVDEHYAAYGLLGRMHMIRAEIGYKLGPEQPDGKREKIQLTPAELQAEYDAAMDYLHAALRQKPDFLYPLINLGLIHSARGEYAIAEPLFAKAVEVNPNYLTTRTAWGDMLVKQGRIRDAIYQYVAAVEIAREDAELRNKLAALYSQIGEFEAAREQWEEALLISPTTKTYLESIAGLEKDSAAPHSEGSGVSPGEDPEAGATDGEGVDTPPAKIGCTTTGAAPGC